jgi:hypothetical protein
VATLLARSQARVPWGRAVALLCSSTSSLRARARELGAASASAEAEAGAAEKTSCCSSALSAGLHSSVSPTSSSRSLWDTQTLLQALALALLLAAAEEEAEAGAEAELLEQQSPCRMTYLNCSSRAPSHWLALALPKPRSRLALLPCPRAASRAAALTRATAQRSS